MPNSPPVEMSDESSPLEMDCPVCGNRFTARPEDFLEIPAREVPPDDVPHSFSLTPDDLEEMNEADLAECGFTVTQREQLLSGAVNETSGAIVICSDCRKALHYGD